MSDAIKPAMNGQQEALPLPSLDLSGGETGIE
jgi:hypothetical protein